MGPVLASREALVRAGGRYQHWDELRHRPPPEGFTHEEWWLAFKFSRAVLLRDLPLEDAQGKRFRVASTDSVQEMLHQVDQRAAGLIAFPDALTNPDTRDRYVVSSLIEEAITSSQMEGASTTRRVAADMLRSGRPPADISERMILNNYEAIQFVRTIQREPLTPERVLELHALVTAGTLADPAAGGRLQRPGDQRVTVVDRGTSEVLFVPPPAEQLPARLAAMCRFANRETPAKGFIHPVVRAVMLHFWLAYDHPFEDGNGRTARALFYWSMLNSGYWLFEYVSISTILRKAFAKYGRSYLHAESDENDATYFLIHQLEVILRAIDALDEYLHAKIAEIKSVEGKLRSTARFNHRQLALLGHALRHPGAEYTIKSHRLSHNVAYATARADLLTLVKNRLLLQGGRDDKTMIFAVPEDIAVRLEGRGWQR
jgi:Fic family protein